MAKEVIFTKELEDSIIKDYQEGMRWKQLMNKYKCSEKPIYKVLTKYNIKKRAITNTDTWGTGKLELLKKLYLDNATYNEMYKKLNCSGGTLTYWIRKLNLPMRGSGRNNIFKNPFLDNTPERDYWLGYLFADGHIGQGRITLTTSNKEVADEFNKFCGGICKIYKRKYTTSLGEEKTMYWPSLLSTTICNWFMQTYNIESDKRYNLNPNIKLNWDIIRGSFDGDGSAHKNGGLVITSGSKKWILKIKKFFEDNNIYCTLSVNDSAYTIAVWRKSELKKLVPLLYSNQTFYLKYKYNRLEPYIGNNIMKTE